MTSLKLSRQAILALALPSATMALALDNSNFADVRARSTGAVHHGTSSGIGYLPSWTVLGNHGVVIETGITPASSGDSAFRFHTLTGNFGDNKLDQCLPIDPSLDISFRFDLRTNVNPGNAQRIRLNPNFYTDVASCELDLQNDSTGNRLTGGSLSNADRDVRLGSVAGLSANQWHTISAASHGTTGPFLHAAQDIPSGAGALRLSLRVRDDSAADTRRIWLDEIVVEQGPGGANLARNPGFEHRAFVHGDAIDTGPNWLVDRDGDGGLRASAGAFADARSGSNAFVFESLTGNFGASKLDQCISIDGTSELRPSLAAMSLSPHPDLAVRINLDLFSSADCSGSANSGLRIQEDFSLDSTPGTWSRLVSQQSRIPAELAGIQSALLSLRARDRSNGSGNGPGAFQRGIHIDDVALDAAVTCAAEAVVGMYEVKVFMDPDLVLDGNQDLLSSVASAFSTATPRRYHVQYLDTASQELRADGWSIRLRKREDQGTHRLQYKMRYPAGSSGLETALLTAYGDGFDACSPLDVEVDWGYGGNKTLSFQDQLSISVPGLSGLDLPSLPQSRTLAESHLLSELADWNGGTWAQDQIDAARLYGVVYFERHVGEFHGLPLNIEVWHLIDEAGTGIEYVVEASFKTTGFGTASGTRQLLIDTITSSGWLLPQDVLKTQMILDRY